MASSRAAALRTRTEPASSAEMAIQSRSCDNEPVRSHQDASKKRPVKQLVRAILIDDAGNLIFFKRKKPGRPLYWTTPGGHVDRTDSSLQAALHRELSEELNARAADVARVFIYSFVAPDGLVIEHFFVARLTEMDESAARSGPEFQHPEINGTYEIGKVDLHQSGLQSLDLKPEPLKEFILANQSALIVLAGLKN